MFTMANGKVKDDSVIFKYDKDLKTELEEFDDLGKVRNKIISNNFVATSMLVTDAGVWWQL